MATMVLGARVTFFSAPLEIWGEMAEPERGSLSASCQVPSGGASASFSALLRVSLGLLEGFDRLALIVLDGCCGHRALLRSRD